MLLIMKILAAATLVVFVPKMALWWPSMSGVVGAMPTISLLCLFCIYLQDGGERKVVDYSATAALGMIPAAILYIGIYVAIKKFGMSIPIALGIGIGLWLAIVFSYQYCLSLFCTTGLTQ